MEFAEPTALVPSRTLSKCLDIATTSHIGILTCSTGGPSGAIVRMGQGSAMSPEDDGSER